MVNLKVVTHYLNFLLVLVVVVSEFVQISLSNDLISSFSLFTFLQFSCLIASILSSNIPAILTS